MKAKLIVLTVAVALVAVAAASAARLDLIRGTGFEPALALKHLVHDSSPRP